MPQTESRNGLWGRPVEARDVALTQLRSETSFDSPERGSPKNRRGKTKRPEPHRLAIFASANLHGLPRPRKSWQSQEVQMPSQGDAAAQGGPNVSPDCV